MTARSIAVIGLGTFGAAMARHLARFGDHVLGIDRDESVVARLADDLTRSVILDAREPKALAEAGLGSYDVAVICMASDLEANLLAVMNAKDTGVPEVWAKAASSTHHRILQQVGIDRILTPEESFGELVAQSLHNPLMRGSVRLTSELHLAFVEAPRCVHGQKLAAIPFERRYDLRCLGLLRGKVPVACGGDEEVAEGDSLFLIGTRPAMRSFVDRN
ncbi:potassium channel family protein [Parvularcula maris]|uniref:TrkA family potassium uptake protein n=1 Tax=Parvularcula maris TaxID=2965077 RepID=A0A9X2LB56_9PROT|nr:TrkA family potassium uptake protein [Parvularcula maris]MCQ8186253.1 TrkA family potassium uptake protein [Parvularcula maris]